MSLYNDSVWATCPADILHFNIWPAVIQHTIGEAAFTEKSVLGWRDKILSAEKWLDVSKVSVSLRHRYNFERAIQNICVYRDNLIVTTDTAATYFDINNFEVIKTLQFEPLNQYFFELEDNWELARINRTRFGCDTGYRQAHEEYMRRRRSPEELETDTESI
ncbi:uncharacterized protein LOC112048564 [Bicyclus anynana]|uniref:Uncharacterized protein LOC112048564 n=1 Tax=Bicyclus anynana TaxID=110368 RepID=A0ABM3LHS1_BICAN|nr:uncharacterized protein LOC112048564 [Bicyclus anynana]